MSLDFELLDVDCHAILRMPVVGGSITSYVSHRLPVVSVQAHFLLNGIPTAEVQVAAGRDAHTDEVARIHYLVKDLSVYVPIQLWLRVRSLDRSTDAFLERWPRTHFVLFEGYVTGIGSDTSFGRHRLVLSCTHWLCDLAFSSAVSRTSAPDNPSGVSFGAAFRNLTAGGATDPAYWTTGAHAAIFSTANLTEDFWAKALAPWLANLCAHDRFVLRAAGAGSSTDVNYEALRALMNFEGADPANPGVYTFGVPLDLTADGRVTSLLARSISASMSRITADSVATTTIWDLLSGDMTGQFLFAVVPMIRRALVVPVVPGLRRIWWTVRPGEYDGIQTDCTVTRPLRGVAIEAPVHLGGGSSLAVPGQQGALPGVAGYFEPADPRHKKGMFLLRRAPAWTWATSPAFNAAAAAAPTAVKGAAAAPGGGTPVPDAAKHDARFGDLRSFWDDYARLLYVTERLRGRQASMRTRFRLDVAPGSSLAVDLASDPFVREALGPGLKDANTVYGHVTRVSLILDAEAQQAFTLLQLSHLRTKTENEEDATSIEAHPYFGTPWAGAPLADWYAET